MTTVIPAGYRSKLGLYDTQSAIALIKREFQQKLSSALNLKRVSAPLFVEPDTGLNDNLNGVERPVSFDIPYANTNAEVVHSLAKWKRMALHRYGFFPGNGLYTDMNAIRRDEELDNLHSVYVDQWDWEKVMPEGTRNMEYLMSTVRDIVRCIYETQEAVKKKYTAITATVAPDVKFLTSQELEDTYPGSTPEQREYLAAKEYGTIFVMQIGGQLQSGKRHGGRAPDYDDWSLNGDIIVYDALCDRAVELSSMGIRVDADTLDKQLTLAHCDDRRTHSFHRMLLNDELPQTIGGGIGQSRLCMIMLEKAHIGEVQSSVWDAATAKTCLDAGVILL